MKLKYRKIIPEKIEKLYKRRYKRFIKRTKKKWVYFPYEECPDCGDIIEVYTDSETEGQFYDGDVAKCVACDFSSYLSVDEGECYISEPEPKTKETENDTLIY